jgi:hypothetical protein
MKEFAFEFMVENFDRHLRQDDDIEDENLEILWNEWSGEASPGSSNGQEYICFCVEANSASEALENTLKRFKEILPDVKVLRLDDDLCTIEDIVSRTEWAEQAMTKEAVLQLIEDHGGFSCFPRPAGVVKRQQVWRWADLSTWLRNVGIDCDHGVELIDWNTAAKFNALLASS